MSERIVGTCGNCGGAVTVPTIFHSTVPPSPKCRSCGATPKESHGPVIPMNPSKPGMDWTRPLMPVPSRDKLPPHMRLPTK